jgi:hypothetical protein
MSPRTFGLSADDFQNIELYVEYINYLGTELAYKPYHVPHFW